MNVNFRYSIKFKIFLSSLHRITTTSQSILPKITSTESTTTTETATNSTAESTPIETQIKLPENTSTNATVKGEDVGLAEGRKVEPLQPLNSAEIAVANEDGLSSNERRKLSNVNDKNGHFDMGGKDNEKHSQEASDVIMASFPDTSQAGLPDFRRDSLPF